MFNLVVMTNSRLESTIRILGQLLNFQEYGSLVLSDSGGRGVEVFREEALRIGINISDIKFIDNSEYKLDPIKHFHALLGSEMKNLFIFHDDDEIIEVEFERTLKYLARSEVKFYCSTKTTNKQFLDALPSYSQVDRLNRVLKAYFLSHDGNCPLLTGLYIKEPAHFLSTISDDFLIRGKYGDVAIMGWCFSQDMAEIAHPPYMKYIEHDSNGNKIRNLKDRIVLSDFVRSRFGLGNRILSLLIFRGYPEKRHLYFLGIFLTIFYPALWLAIVRKLLSRGERRDA